jgi:hypothetical protein
MKQIFKFIFFAVLLIICIWFFRKPQKQFLFRVNNVDYALNQELDSFIFQIKQNNENVYYENSTLIDKNGVKLYIWKSQRDSTSIYSENYFYNNKFGACKLTYFNYSKFGSEIDGFIRKNKLAENCNKSGYKLIVEKPDKITRNAITITLISDDLLKYEREICER